MVVFTPKFAPLKPSNLRISSVPLSPASPVTSSYSRRASTSLTSSPPLKPSCLPPPLPLQWLWSCHLCHHRYPIGTTRRCLQDGHFFCSGVAISKRTGAMKKHIACASEFDYVGWKAWAEWRQEAYAYTPRNDGKKDCKNACAWPSECRWGKKHGVNIPTTQKTYEAYSPSSPSSAPKTDKPRSSLFLDRLIKSAEKKSAGRKALLSAVEEEEARSPTSPLKVPYELPDLQLPTLTSKSKDSENSSEDIRMSDAKGENSSYSAGSVSDDASALKQPTFSSDTTLTENEQIIEYASADINFDFASDNALASTWFTEKSPTSPGRRNAWDWSVEVPDNMALADNLACDEHVVWEGVNFFDVEML